MNLEVDDDKKAEIGNAITSEDSPVGIDAKKTHIIIINKLVEIEKRLDALENPIDMQVELGDTSVKEMIYSGIMTLVGGIIIVISSFMKLRNYRIAHPDENIT